MIPQGYEITGDMVPRVRNILGVPDRRDTGTSYKTTTICQAGHSLCRDKSLKKFSVGRDAGSSLEIVSVPLKSGRLAAMQFIRPLHKQIARFKVQ